MTTVRARDIEQRMHGLAQIGRTPRGFWRLAWTAEDRLARDWFEAQAIAIDLRYVRDEAGNLWALPDGDAPFWAVGSHLDTVRFGGAYDGALGVVVGFEVAERSQARVAVVSFADEEGARFNTPTFGSRVLAGRLDPMVLQRQDEHGTTLSEALRVDGIDPETLEAAQRVLDKVRGLLEVHIDQTVDLEVAAQAAGVVAALAGRCRLRLEIAGRADHAGTTPLDSRADALLAAARVVVALDALGRQAGARITSTRASVEPNAATTVADAVVLGVDLRAPDEAAMTGLLEQLARVAAETAEPCSCAVEQESRSPAASFDVALRDALRRALGHEDEPDLLCYAGHDAGVLAERLPAAMVMVRNPTGLSHHRDEWVRAEDAAVATSAVLIALEELEAGSA